MVEEEQRQLPKFFMVLLTGQDIDEIAWSIEQMLHSKGRTKISPDVCANDACLFCSGQKALIEIVRAKRPWPVS